MAPTQSASMMALAGASADDRPTSAVGAWVLARARRAKWTPPVHDVDGESWKADFEFHETLGRGGFGSVVHATHRATGTDVAVKLIYDRTEDGAPTAKSESVRRELATMGRMHHPHIVQLVEVFAQRPTPQAADPAAPWTRRWYLILELVHGRDLQSLVATRGALEVDKAQVAFAQVARALQYAHWRGVIHRDVKPGNVMLVDESYTGGEVRVMLLDFGLAELMDAEFVRRYRRRARARAKRQGLALSRMLTDQDSVHPRGLWGAKGPDTETEEDESGSKGRAGGTPQPTPAERPAGTRPADRARGHAGAGDPSRMSAALVPTGTPAFAAPEVYDETRFTADKSAVGGAVDGVKVPVPVVTDSYSLGVMLEYLLTGVPPETRRPAAYVRARRSAPWALAGRAAAACARRPPRKLRLVTELPEEAQALIRRLKDTSPATRMTIGEVVAHPWVTAVAAGDEAPPARPPGQDKAGPAWFPVSVIMGAGGS